MQKAGILGGGQLGKMLLQAAANYPVETYVMEKSADCPSAHLCNHFVLGDINDYDQVYNFGKGLDVVTIEIEHVNVPALKQLAKDGVRVIPHPAILETIQNKITQKDFYIQHQIPTADYIVTQNKAELSQYLHRLPAVHKLNKGGYDGRGVQILKDEDDLPLAFDEPAVLEKKIAIEREISMLVARNEKGDIAIYPPVEMMMDPYLNQLDYQISPATLPEKVYWKAEAIAIKVVQSFKSAGLFAIELMIDAQQDIWVNETAPRVHNSGHHTIEGNYCSQFDMLWRILLNYPLGNTEPIAPTVMVNLIGAPTFSGNAVYKGLEDVLSLDHCFVHIYGKKETKPGRKMGHITILHADRTELLHVCNKVKHAIQIISE
ncbi:MAG: 5-(carboxyamino)imidazole ribonucleotide synthase [Chitinophagia bacterium]|jgi:5-(carboxyamino)imidazole ribonucleotide synthase